MYINYYIYVEPRTDVKERTEKMINHKILFRAMLKACHAHKPFQIEQLCLIISLHGSICVPVTAYKLLSHFAKHFCKNFNFVK